MPKLTIASFAACFLFSLLGCVETDGQPILHEVHQSSCPGGGPKRDPVNPDVIAAFYPCCDGSAHLIPDFLVPETFRSMLEKGPDGSGSLCVPDEFATDPNYTPRKCKSLFGQPGACISACVPQVRNAPTPLPKDVCSANQRCAPCVDPRTNEETGACKMGQMACEPPPDTSGPCKDWEPTMDVNQYPVCCPGARCTPKEFVDAKLAKDLNPCAGGYCVPEKFLARGGKFTPKTCRSLNNAEGRCLSKCIKSVASQANQLPQADCDRGEVCAPCYDPRTGYGTGACSAGHCDKGPQEPPKLFEPCGAGGTDAYCVPAELVPARDRCNFDNLGCRKSPCGAGMICVPKPIMDAGPTFEPKRCTNKLIGFLAGFQKFFKGDLFAAIRAMKAYKEGRCLSRCMPKVRAKAGLLGRSGCAEHEVCVPCWDPQKLDQGKVPTGACNRPACPGR